MSDLNIKDFLACGAFLQTGANLFKVLVGPFAAQDISQITDLKHPTLLYKPNFWDFLQRPLGKPLNLTQKSVYFSAKIYTLNREEFIHHLQSFKPQAPNIRWKAPNEAQFKAQFEWSQKNFIEQKLLKTVPIIREQAEVKFTLENLAYCVLSLLQHKNFGWSYGYFENSVGMIGHTPEVLAHWTQIDRQLHTVALAGTRVQSENAYTQILTDKKIRHEHQIVIEDINTKLKSLAFGLDFGGLNFNLKITQGETDVLALTDLLHLMTEFQIEVDNIEQALAVIQALHPTSAMGLYPFSLDKLIEFSEFNLQKERRTFAAPFALIEENALYCVVAIRNLMFNKEHVQIFSGCGVTAESQYELELTEAQNKRNSVKKMLGLFKAQHD